MIKKQQITEDLTRFRINREEAEAFFESDVGIATIHAYLDLVDEFIENQDRMFNTYPELVGLFEFAVLVRGPSFMAKHPENENSPFTFLSTAVMSSRPEAFLSAAARHVTGGINVSDS